MSHPQPGTCSKGCDLREKSCTSGRLRVWCCGARTFVVVFVDRYDCRSRQAVPGIVRPCAKSARSRTLPSHPSREQRSANGLRKPAPRGQARSTVTGSHPIPGMGSVERSSPGSTCRWKASRVIASSRLWRGAAEVTLGVRETDGRTDGRSQSVRDRRRQRSLVQRRRIRKRCVVASSCGSSDAMSSERRPARERFSVHGKDRSSHHAVKRG
jgi:hypothetical protein